MVAVTQYYAKVGISIDNSQLKKVDRYFKLIEAKLSRFHKKTNILNFSVNMRGLEKKLGDALDSVSRKVVFEISNFVVNKRNLQAAITNAAGKLVVPSSSNAPFGIAPLSPKEWNRRTLMSAKLRREEAIARQNERLELANLRNNRMASVPLIGRSPIGFGMLPSLAGVGGALGMAQLNQANQQMISSNIAAESVLGSNAKPLLDWLAKRSDYLGVSYADTLPQFTKFMASSSPLMGQEASKDVFSSFMQFGRTRGADKVSMNRALTAIGQMSAKGQVMAEELKQQLGDAAGFGELPQLFAEAFQIKTGGSLKGAEARSALMDAMQKGNVKTSDVLPIVSRLMNELSKGGIDKARTSSVAEQMRAENALIGRGGLLQTFSEAGGEQGFSRFWKEMTTIFKEMTPTVKALGGAFNDLTVLMQTLRNATIGFNRILEQTAESTGLAEKDIIKLAAAGTLLMSKWGRVAAMFTAIILVMEDISYGMAGKDSYTKDFLDFLESNGMSEGASKITAISAALLAVAAGLKAISAASSLPGVGDILGSPKSKEGGKMGKRGISGTIAKAGVAVGLLGLGGYLASDSAVPDYLKQPLQYGIAGSVYGPYGSAVGAIAGFAMPRWESKLSVDPQTGYRDVPYQDQTDLVEAMILAKEDNKYRQSQDVNVKVELKANITAENANDFAGRVVDVLNREISRVLPNYSYSGVQVPLATQ